MPVPEKRERELEIGLKEGVPILSFGTKPRGQKICTFLFDVQIIQVDANGIRLQERVGGIAGRIHVFKPNAEQVKLLTPYLWAYLKVEASILLPDVEEGAA